MNGNLFYLKGLDSLRAVAALSVIVSHIEDYKSYNRIPRLKFVAESIGQIGVILFFTLSGFLITLLLLKEKQQFGSIDFKKFYVRRILRIWPLYYFTILLSALLLNYKPDMMMLLMCLTILPNLANALYGGWVASPQIWSIGVEEQFYLCWPFLVNKINTSVWALLILIFIALSLIPQLILWTMNYSIPDSGLIVKLNHIFYYSKFQCLVSGGIAAYLYFTGSRILKYFTFRGITIICIIIPIGFWIRGFNIPYFRDELFSTMFAIMILCVVCNKSIFLITNNKVLDYLGKISYGMYMYHWIIITLCFKYFKWLFNQNNTTMNLIIYFLVIGGTILVSHISFKWFESYFLNKKMKFTRNQVNNSD